MINHQRADIDKLAQHYRTNYEPCVDDGLTKLHARMAHVDIAKPKKARPAIFQLAAALALIVAALAVWKFAFAEDPNLLYAEAETRQVTLEDGSQILLNHHTSIQLDENFNDTERRVKIDGEAFFQVASDPLRPFIIDNGKSVVRVVGTAFNLSQDEKGFIVEVSEGLVELHHGTDFIELGPKQCGMVQNDRLSSMDAPHLNRHAWRTGQIVFEDTAFGKVLADLSSAYRVKWNMQLSPNHGCTNLGFTARFNDDPIEEVIVAIERHYGLDITPVSGQENRYSITGSCR
ncbi:MAG: FecR domain-containing protein [Bacteroidota bacterium]